MFIFVFYFVFIVSAYTLFLINIFENKMVFQTSMPSYRYVYHLYPSFLNMYRGEKSCAYQYRGVSIWYDFIGV